MELLVFEVCDEFLVFVFDMQEFEFFRLWSFNFDPQRVSSPKKRSLKILKPLQPLLLKIVLALLLKFRDPVNKSPIPVANKSVCELLFAQKRLDLEAIGEQAIILLHLQYKF